MAQELANQGRIEANGPRGHVHSLDDLVDVSTAGAIGGDSLMHNGVGWYPGPSVPVGTILALATPDPPDLYTRADGRAISRTSYPDLFSAIGTTYGAGDGTSTFNVPHCTGTLGGVAVWWYIRL